MLLSLYLAVLDDQSKEEQFIDVYNTYKRLVYHTAYKIMGDSYLAEDVLQEVFLYVAKNFSKIHRENCHELAAYTVRCSIIQPGRQSLFDNEHTVYETVKVGEADGVLGTSTDEHGKNVYTLSWEYQGITHTVMGNIPYDEIMKIAEGIR